LAAKVTGTIDVNLEGASIAPARPPYTYLGVADALLPGIMCLSEAPKPSGLSLCLLAAHTLECLLKAYLSRNGSDKDVVTPEIRHNLAALWERAASEGLAILAEPPHWAVRLSELHDNPYYLRYSTGVHGIVMPPTASVVSGLMELRKSVGNSLT
jgi:hypothetical protein